MSRRNAIWAVAFAVAIIGAAISQHHQHAVRQAKAAEPVAQPALGTSALDEVLTPAQRDAFTEATADLALLMYADALPREQGIAKVRDGCTKLHGARHPLLAALSATCAPNIELARATTRAYRGCNDDDPWRRCVHVMHLRAKALYAYAISERGLAHAIRRSVPAGPCRRALAPTHAVVAADLANARATRRYAEAIAADNLGWQDAEWHRMKTNAHIADRAAVYLHTKEMARACHLPSWSFEPR